MHPEPVARKTVGRAGRRGILVGGDFVVDRVKLLAGFPEQDTLANILGEARPNGGYPSSVPRR
jgi:hypothetical protein